MFGLITVHPVLSSLSVRHWHSFVSYKCVRDKISVKYYSWRLKLGASPLSSVYSPWDQSGWRCERGRCRCSRSRQRGELHRPSRASRARPTHGAQMHVASAGAAAVAVPGRSSPSRELTHCGPAWLTLLHTGQHSLSYCVSAAGSGLCSWYFFFACDLRALVQPCYNVKHVSTSVSYLLWLWEMWAFEISAVHSIIL